MVKSFTTALLKVAALSSVVLCASNAQAQKTLYLCDVATEAELTEDICGVPMKIDHLGDYKYRARYYNENANTEIYFLTSKTSLGSCAKVRDLWLSLSHGLLHMSPSLSLVYGLNNGELDRGPMSKMDPFILPEPNTYYEINLDLDNFTYSLTSYEVADYMDPVFYEYGGDHLNMWFNFIDSTNGEWENTDEAWMQPLYFGYATGPKDVTPFTQDGLNPTSITLHRKTSILRPDRPLAL
ncbi:MAG: hypothetical protein LIP03_14570 [Bacteroidales bacterium]|nr:hypothetical protein [Bacteroidales bacterium]